MYADKLKKKILLKLKNMEKMLQDLKETIEFYIWKKFLMVRLIKQINFPADLRKFKKKILNKFQMN